MTRRLLLHYASYNKWANVRLLDALSELDLSRGDKVLTTDASLPLRDIRSTLNHILAADALWFSRFTGATRVGHLEVTTLRSLWAGSPGDGQWADVGLPDGELDTLSAELRAQSERWIALADAMSEADATSGMRYLDTEGAAHEVNRAFTMMHVFNHATHHRGQISAAMTAFGARPVELDMVYFARAAEGALAAASPAVVVAACPPSCSEA